jgi:hypothetical protein
MATVYTHKMVDGVEVPLTPEEIAAFEARDAAWEALAPIREAKMRRNDAINNNPERKELAALLKDGTIAQMDAWVEAYAGNPPAMRQVLKVLLRMLANTGPA